MSGFKVISQFMGIPGYFLILKMEMQDMAVFSHHFFVSETPGMKLPFLQH